MYLILLIVALAILRGFEVWRFAEMSWWVVIGLMALAFIWFEYVEKIFGLDKKKEHQIDEQRRNERVKKTFDKTRR